LQLEEAVDRRTSPDRAPISEGSKHDELEKEKEKKHVFVLYNYFRGDNTTTMNVIQTAMVCCLHSKSLRRSQDRDSISSFEGPEIEGVFFTKSSAL
jgi:hypothetical protein